MTKFLDLKFRKNRRDRMEDFFESKGFQSVITTVIILNSILIGLETSEEVVLRFGRLIDLFDKVILWVFVAEIVLKIWAYRFRFFRDPWNNFDFLIVAIALIPTAGAFSIFRALRIIRTLRLLKSIPRLRLIIESLVKSFPSIGWIVVLLFIVFYIYSVVGVNLFGEAYPVYFGDIPKSFFTLFQIMTLESWSSAIARPVMDGVPYSGIYFITFILIATYTTLNIFIAIVVNTMNEVSLSNLQAEEEHIKDYVHQENKKLEARLIDMQKTLEELKNNRETEQII